GQLISGIGGLGSLLPFGVGPQQQMGQLTPQGWFGNLVSSVAPTIGNQVGGTAGQLISGIGGLGSLLPFGVGPQQQMGQLTPQGWFGNLVSSVAPTIGNQVGGTAGQIISGLGSLGSVLPFGVGPQQQMGQLAPQGWFGNLVSNRAPTVGGAVGGAPGQIIAGLGSIGALLPFGVGPQQQMGQLTPQGWFGNLVSNLAPTVGGAVGGTPGQIISGLGSLGSLLPFGVGPQQQMGQLTPHGWLGNLVSSLAPAIGN